MATPAWARANPSTRTSGRHEPRSPPPSSSSSQRGSGATGSGVMLASTGVRGSFRASQASASDWTAAARADVNCQAASA